MNNYRLLTELKMYILPLYTSYLEKKHVKGRILQQRVQIPPYLFRKPGKPSS